MGIGRADPGRQPRPSRSLQRPRQPHYREALEHSVGLVDTICRLAGADSLIGPETTQLRQAILDHDTPYLFELMVRSFSLQGISNHAAWTYMEKNDPVTWRGLQLANRKPPVCSKLQGYWTFCGCGYRKDARTCAEPATLPKCSVPRHALRNGRLNQMAYSLFLFIRDIADENLIDWIDRSLAHANSGRNPDRLHRMRRALIQPLRNVYGVSDKILNMTLAGILLAAPVSKPHWLEVGSSMIAIDTLVHNFFSRTGITSRLGVSHAYGTACYSANGCADIVRTVSRLIDANQFNSNYPQNFPRFVQHAIWRYCAQSEL